MIAGPTGSGKSLFALRLAKAVSGEIVNYDSIQVYRGFDIGSAKPSLVERQELPHHLYDLVDAGEDYDASRFAREALVVCDEIASRGLRPILTGGTFFYLRALLQGLPSIPGRDENIRARLRRLAARPRGPQHLHRWLSKVDPRSGARVPAGDRHRVERALEVWMLTGQPISQWEAPSAQSDREIVAIRIGLSMSRERLVPVLERRVEAMYASGLVQETAGLLQSYSSDARPFAAIGYREAVQVVRGLITEAAAIMETKRRTRGYAKRQMTWLRSERNVHWVDASDPEAALQAALRVIEGQD
ncbi:MAG: tRNA (adenosine(37)-N6)-dimethylallyltransferase MiaA [Thermoanaerobaculia bacterium]